MKQSLYNTSFLSLLFFSFCISNSLRKCLPHYLTEMDLAPFSTECFRLLRNFNVLFLADFNELLKLLQIMIFLYLSQVCLNLNFFLSYVCPYLIFVPVLRLSLFYVIGMSYVCPMSHVHVCLSYAYLVLHLSVPLLS